MATTPEDVKKNESDYADAFNDNTPPAPEPTEDEAFGLGMGALCRDYLAQCFLDAVWRQ